MPSKPRARHHRSEEDRGFEGNVLAESLPHQQHHQTNAGRNLQPGETSVQIPFGQRPVEPRQSHRTIQRSCWAAPSAESQPAFGMLACKPVKGTSDMRTAARPAGTPQRSSPAGANAVGPREDLAQCNLCRSYQSPPAWSAHAHSR